MFSYWQPVSLGHRHVRRIRHGLSRHLVQHQTEDPEHVENLVLNIDSVHPMDGSDGTELRAQPLVLLFQHVRHRGERHQSVVDRLVGVGIVARALGTERHLHQRAAGSNVLVGRILEARQRNLCQVVDEENRKAFGPEPLLHTA